jgi:hypothetical protein
MGKKKMIKRKSLLNEKERKEKKKTKRIGTIFETGFSRRPKNIEEGYIALQLIHIYVQEGT